VSVKILVVDDNEAICSGLCELLERANPNYNCESASDGEEALIKAKASKPDVVILDFSMPGMGGLSSARLISHRLPGTKILLHTAHRNEMLEANAFRYGVFRVVDKTDGRNLLPVIREIASRHPEQAS
jgi:two-component system, NarL family, invasion response regulator UvrY